MSTGTTPFSCLSCGNDLRIPEWGAIFVVPCPLLAFGLIVVLVLGIVVGSIILHALLLFAAIILPFLTHALLPFSKVNGIADKSIED